MPPNNRRRKVKPNAVCGQLLREKGDKDGYKNKSFHCGAEFHQLPHMFQEAPKISEFTSGDNRTKHVQSILERNALDEFLETSLALQNDFEKTNNVRILIRQSDQQQRNQETTVTPTAQPAHVPRVTIPRRPINYVSGAPEKIVSTQELVALEENAFFKWRLDLAHIEEQEGRVMTPFERNLQFWRQLWRVLERSNVVFQILDARNPLFYRCEDLELYATELHTSKKVILLLNKSDLVPRSTRRLWAEYFQSLNVPCLFFSALDELARQDTSRCEDSNASGKKDFVNGHDEGGIASSNSSSCVHPPNKNDVSRNEDYAAYFSRLSRNGDVLNGDQLLEVMQWLKDFAQKSPEASMHFGSTKKPCDKLNAAVPLDPGTGSCVSKCCDDDVERDKHFFIMRQSLEFTVGLVGYPNVGKSSVINSVLGHKAVSVSRQPGKTKHFQTIPLPSVQLTLCDCPGLVFPQTVSTRAHLVINGVSPIDHMRGDFVAPVQLICNHIPNQLLQHYNITSLCSAADTCRTMGPSAKPQFRAVGTSVSHLSAREVLASLGIFRHRIAGGRGGVPQLFEMAKLIIRDYCTGKLLHWEFPPNISPSQLSDQDDCDRVLRPNKMPGVLANSATDDSGDQQTTTSDKQSLPDTNEDLLLQLVAEDRASLGATQANASEKNGSGAAVMTKRKARHLQKQLLQNQNVNYVTSKR